MGGRGALKQGISQDSGGEHKWRERWPSRQPHPQLSMRRTVWESAPKTTTAGIVCKTLNSTPFLTHCYVWGRYVDFSSYPCNLFGDSQVGESKSTSTCRQCLSTVEAVQQWQAKVLFLGRTLFTQARHRSHPSSTLKLYDTLILLLKGPQTSREAGHANIQTQMWRTAAGVARSQVRHKLEGDTGLFTNKNTAIYTFSTESGDSSALCRKSLKWDVFTGWNLAAFMLANLITIWFLLKCDF